MRWLWPCVLLPMACLATKRGLADPAVTGKDYLCSDWRAAAAWTHTAEPFAYAYSWGLEAGGCPEFSPAAFPKNASAGRLGFVPMLWGRGGLSSANATKLRSEFAPVALLGFNEPNHRSQSNIEPAEAAALWPAVEAIARELNVTTLVSPAAAPCGGPVPRVCTYGDALPWFTAFAGNCSGCRLDAIATHFYGCKLSELQTYLTQLHALFQKPIWLTEFNCGGGTTDVPIPKQLAWMQEAVTWLEATPWIAHYSWMSGRDGHDPEARLFNVSATGVVQPTVLGELYLRL